MDVKRSSQIDLAKADAFGGKASGLLKLTAYGAPVPPFLVVSPDAFFRHLPKALFEAFVEEEKQVKNDDLTVSRPAAEALSNALLDLNFDQAFETSLQEALSNLGADHYAIRSSMLGEDSAEHSFAGQLESYLFQRGLDAVGYSIRKCWRSAFQNRVLAYRKRANLNPADIRVAVVVQKMVDSKSAGVLFTAHPQTGHRNRMLISGAWGQGEGVVSGACNCDEFVWEANTGEIDCIIANKDRYFIPAPSEHSGAKEIETPMDWRKERCLSKEQVDTLCQSAQRLQHSFGYPLDIEWAVENNKIYFLQARPITALPEAPNTVGPLVVWDNSNIQESYCGVTTPLTFSYAQRAYATVYRQTLEALSVPKSTIAANEPKLRNLLGIVKGRIFYNINNWYAGLQLLPSFGKNKSDMEEMMGLTDPVEFIEDQTLTLWEKLVKAPRMLLTLYRLLRAFKRLPKEVESFQNHYEKTAAEVDPETVSKMRFSELMALNEHLRLEIQEKWHIPIINDFYVMMSTGGLRRFLTQCGFENAVTLQNHLLAGEPGIESAEPTKILVGLADEIRKNTQLMKLFDVDDEAFILQGLLRSKHKKVIEHYLHRYGDRVMGELKLETKTLRHDPSFLIQILRNYISNDNLSLESLLDQEQKLRHDAETKVYKRLSFFKARKARKKIENMRAAVKNRENMRLTRTRAFGLSREIYLAIGARLTEANRLNHADDVFYLTVDEIEAYHEGRCINADLRGLCAVRRTEFEDYETDDIAHHFKTIGPIYFGNRFLYDGKIDIDPNASVLTGLGCYPGKVDAPIQLIFKPEDAKDLKGKILCTVRTDPGWAPLFPSVSGILVERGSTLSHSAVVARELGIPAVVNIPGLTEILQDGERVKMDGDRGTVLRLEQEGGTDDNT